jgi:DNA-binding winged helix-turn-helix (wHTH) protein/TolB-like protein
MLLEPPPKTIDILKVLVQNAGEVITAESITETVWPHAIVGEEDVNSHIHALRKVLEDAHEESRYVRSIAGQGFRFVEPVSELLATSCEEDVKRRPTLVVSEAPPAGKKPSGAGKTLAVSAVILLLAAAGIWAVFFRHQSPAKPQLKIAVLPVNSLGGGKEDKPSNDAFTSALITELGKSAKISSFEEVQKYNGGFSDPAAAGLALGANAVVTGMIQRSSNDVRVSLQMFDTKDGSPIWAGTFDGQSSDISVLSEKMSSAAAKHFHQTDDSTDQQ